MKIFDRYIEKQIVYEAFINEKPEKDLRNIIVIPCYNEPNFIQTLNSLNSCKPSQNPVEVIAVINSAAHSDSHVLLQNQKTKIEIESWQKNHKTKKLKIHFIFVENISSKYAGAGFARKIGMDEAIRRFKLIRNEMGIITSLDADSIVSDNYLAEIEQFFDDKPQLNGCSIYFEHPITGSEHPEIVYKRITEYELYLRYYSLSLKYTGFPHYFHTVGSSFAVRAKTYCKQGGMNRKKAGEDFYFLQKIMSLGNYEYLNTVTVIPSSRPSDRVPSLKIILKFLTEHF